MPRGVRRTTRCSPKGLSTPPAGPASAAASTGSIWVPAKLTGESYGPTVGVGAHGGLSSACTTRKRAARYSGAAATLTTKHLPCKLAGAVELGRVDDEGTCAGGRSHSPGTDPAALRRRWRAEHADVGATAHTSKTVGKLRGVATHGYTRWSTLTAGSDWPAARRRWTGTNPKSVVFVSERAAQGWECTRLPRRPNPNQLSNLDSPSPLSTARL